jgi:hypothetical protein
MKNTNIVLILDDMINKITTNNIIYSHKIISKNLKNSN